MIFIEFEKVTNPRKYEIFKKQASKITKYVGFFLNEDANEKEKAVTFNICCNLVLYQQRMLLKNLDVYEGLFYECKLKGLINKDERDRLISSLGQKGKTTAKRKFLFILLKKAPDQYATLLIILDLQKADFIEEHVDDLHKMLAKCGSKAERPATIKAYVETLIRRTWESDSVVAEPDSTYLRDMDKSKEEVQFDRDPNESGMGAVGGEQASVVSDVEMAVQKIAESTFGVTGGFASINDEVSLDVGMDTDEDLEEDDDGIESLLQDPDKFCNSDLNDILGQLKNKKVHDLLAFYPQIPSNTGGKADLKMRSYQKELAEKGIRGENVLICAPTGSGKTIVAVKIVADHLEKTKNAKVAFLVHRIALVEQQFNQFSKYLDQKWRITKLSGPTKSSGVPLVGQLGNFDLFIFTSDILRNALESDEEETKLKKSVCEFSLIMFDECHNCDKKHPYNRIMTHYFAKKQKSQTVLTRPDYQLPQIIGLTASTGTNKAQNMKNALARLYTLCANLDTYVVSTVKENQEELKDNQSVPTEKIITPKSRDIDDFEEDLQKLMHNCEYILYQMKARDFFPDTPYFQSILNIPSDRLHQKYFNFVAKLHKDILINTADKNDGKATVYAISTYLSMYVRAMMVNHLFRGQDAYDLINKSIRMDTPATCAVEKILRAHFSKMDCQINLRQSKNPCLQELRKRIRDLIFPKNEQGEVTYNTQSRVIVFVRERVYTQILKDVFANEEPDIPCGTIVGNTISSGEGGLTQNEMDEVLDQFRRGDIVVLFSTTVAEEGLDVQQCNLVIRYGHVTNETAMVQSRGRARAKGSNYLVIVPYKLQWQVNKENINKYREGMMYRAIEKFQEMDLEARKEEIDCCQLEREMLEQVINKTPGSKDKKLSSDQWSFYCRKCNKYICSSNDIRLAQDIHHILINEDLFVNLLTHPIGPGSNKCEIQCSKCQQVVGFRQLYRGRNFPTLKPNTFRMMREASAGEEAVSEVYKKWKDVPFETKSITSRELMDFSLNHTLSD